MIIVRHCSTLCSPDNRILYRLITKYTRSLRDKAFTEAAFKLTLKEIEQTVKDIPEATAKVSYLDTCDIAQIEIKHKGESEYITVFILRISDIVVENTKNHLQLMKDKATEALYYVASKYKKMIVYKKNK